MKFYIYKSKLRITIETVLKFFLFLSVLLYIGLFVHIYVIKFLSVEQRTVFLVLGMFLLIPFASAGLLDSKKSINTKGEDYNLNGKVLKYNKLWEKYKPIEITNLFGKTKKQFALTEHTESCGSDETCLSILNVYTDGNSPIFDDFWFETLQEDGSWIKQDIRWYQLKYYGLVDDYETKCVGKKTKLENGTLIYENCEQIKSGSHYEWISFNVGDILPQGNYEIHFGY